MTQPRLAAALFALRAQINTAYPKRSHLWDGWIGDARHQSIKSDHNPDAAGIVHAVDITHDPTNGCDAAKVTEALRLSRDKRIKYVIYNRRIFSSTVSPWTWRAYSLADSEPHNHHFHVSVTSARSVDVVAWRIA